MPRQRDAALDAARREVELAQSDLWLRYFELGGMAMPSEVESYLLGGLVPSPHDHEVLVHALNERFSELGRNHPVPYATEHNSRPGDKRSAAVGRALHSSRTIAPASARESLGETADQL
jgi:hypothetical protein